MKLLAQLFGPLRHSERDHFEESAVDSHVSAAFLEALQMSHGDLANLLRTTLRSLYPTERTYVWIRDVFDDSVVYELSADDITTLYQRSYTIADGAVTFGEPIKVVAVTQYVAVEQTGVTVPVTQISQPAEESGTTPLTGAIVPLVEKAVGLDSTIKIKVIAPGQGSSGYYGADMLKRDGPKVFTSGLHMYLDHPSISEESDRPERSVKDLAGTLTTAARWEEEGAAGPGLYADAKLRADVAPLIEDIAPHIGVSIQAWGKARNGEVDGKPTRIIDTIEHAGSVDFVTIPGAGGSILQLVESARNRRAQPEGDNDVSKEELEEANRKITELQGRLDENDRREAERKLLAEARTLVVETLAGIVLPVPTRACLTESLAADPPLKDGGLDREALTSKVKEAAAKEVEYLTQATGGNPIRNMGDTTPTTPSHLPTLEESDKRIAAALAAL